MTYGPFDLSRWVALTTGSNGGIGLGMARALAEARADVAIGDTSAVKNAVARRAGAFRLRWKCSAQQVAENVVGEETS